MSLCTRKIFYDATETGPSDSPYVTLGELNFLRNAVFAQACADFADFGDSDLDEVRNAMIEFGYSDGLHEEFSRALDSPSQLDRPLLERVLPVLCKFYFSIREKEVKEIEDALPDGMSFGELVCLLDETNSSKPANDTALYCASFEDNVDGVQQLSNMIELMENILVRPPSTNVAPLSLPRRTLRLGG